MLDAGYLSLWGTALALVHWSVLRLAHIAHCAAAARGWLKAPVTVLPRLKFGSDLLVTAWALACGVASLIAFVVPAGQALAWLAPWLPDRLPLTFQIIRIILAEGVMIGFLVIVAPHPRWKLGWVAAWIVFACFITWVGR